MIMFLMLRCPIIGMGHLWLLENYSGLLLHYDILATQQYLMIPVLVQPKQNLASGPCFVPTFT